MKDKQPKKGDVGPKKKLSRVIEEFLKANPDAKEALDYFGVSDERYQELMESQSRPVFYTTSSTNAVNPGGELD